MARRPFFAQVIRQLGLLGVLFTATYFLLLRVDFPIQIFGPIDPTPIGKMCGDQINRQLNLLREYGLTSTECKQINAFLRGELGEILTRGDKAVPQLDRLEFIDPWGRPFTCVVRKTVSSNRELALFSNGPDGTSESSGNDEDDINTWSGPDDDYWAQARRKSVLQKRLRCAIQLTIIAYLALALFRLSSRRAESEIVAN